MFEKFVQGKIEHEKEIANHIEDISRESIAGSELSDFTKNYILNDFSVDISKDELISRIEKSNKLYFNYTIRPKWTLLNFLFNNFESRPPNEIIKKLNIFPFYKFYIDAIADFIKENFSIFITNREVTHIINETNKAIYKKLTNDITNLKIKNFFLQIFKLKYFNEVDYNLDSTIPYLFIKIYLEDKSYSDLVEKFSIVKDMNEESEISLKDIIKVLIDKYAIAEKVESNIPEQVESSVESPERIIIELPSDKEIIIAEVEPENIYSKELIKATEEKKIMLTDKSEKRNVVKDLFNEKELQKILDEVYNSDIIYREKSFEKLNNYKNWFEASNHLKEIFQINRVNIYNKDVIQFVDTLNEYFQNKR